MCRANHKSGARLAAEQDGTQQTSLLVRVELAHFRRLEQQSGRIVKYCDIMSLLRSPLPSPTNFWGPEIPAGANALDSEARSLPVSSPLPSLSPRMYPLAKHDLAFPV